MSIKTCLQCGLLLYVVIIFIFVITAPAFADARITCRVGIVIEANQTTDVLVIEDACGFLWEYEGIEDITEGDVVVMTMYDNSTPETIFDDVILSVEYSGFIATEIR